MKRITVLVLTILLLTSCEKDDPIDAQRQFLVDKVYDYNHKLLSQYTYNENNQLIKRVTTDAIGSSDYDFEYSDNRISKIEYTDYVFPQFNHIILIYYNEQGKIIRDEMYQYGNLIEFKNYTYFTNGKIKGIINTDGEENINFIYHNTNNIEQVRILTPDIFNPGDYIEMFHDYQYDNGNKPNFGIGQIFQIEPIPHFGTEAMFEKNISLNNMTENLASGTKWIYEYNEFNLPMTVETIWKESVTEEPMLLRFEYKEIK